MPIHYNRLGNNIRVQRKKKKLTQKQLAEIIGCSMEHLSHIENGVRHIQLEMLNDVCECLDVSIEDLLRGAIDVQIRSGNPQNEIDDAVRQFGDIVANYSLEQTNQVLEICPRIVELSNRR